MRKRQLVAVGIGHMEISFTPRSVLRTLWMKSPSPQNYPTARIFRTIVLAACGTFFLPVQSWAELVTFSASGPATFIGRITIGDSEATTPMSELYGGVLGSTLKVSFTWNSNTLPTPQGDPNVTNYFPAATTFSAKASFGDMSFEGLGNLYLSLKSPFGIDENLRGDYAFLAASNTPYFSEPKPTVMFYAQLLYPAGSFKGGATLPDVPPYYANLAIAVGGQTYDLVESYNPHGFAPVPEPATYGILGSVALIGLAVRRGFRNRGLDRSQHA